MNKFLAMSAYIGSAWRQWREMWRFDKNIGIGGDIKQLAEYHMSHRASVKRRKKKRRK